jgi:hypothetical protein
MLQQVIQSGVRTRYAVPDDYVLTANNGTNVITITAADGYITFPAATSYVSGDYRYVITTTDGDIYEAGKFTMLPSLASGDGRTKNQRILDLIDAVLEGRASKNQLASAVGDMSITYLKPSELINFRAHYQDMVDDEIAALTGLNRQTYITRFTGP